MSIDPTETEIAAVQRQLAELDELRLRLEKRLQELTLKSENAAIYAIKPAAKNDAPPAPVANNSSAMEKVALFRRLFGGRMDVFPARWENPKTGRSGYAPACTNEWVRGVCGKPQIKCGDCSNKAFIAVTADVIECHLRGEDRVRPTGAAAISLRASIHCFSMTPAAFWPSTSTMTTGRQTPWHSSRYAVRSVFPRRSNALAPAMAGTSGCFSRSQSQRRMLAVSEPCC
jgi:ribosomal protein S27E